jgi:hypothetical protein
LPFDPITILTPETGDLQHDTPDEELVTIGYCHYGTVSDDFCESLLFMRDYDREHGQHWDQIVKAKGPYIPLSRNDIVNAFLEQRFAHWLLFLDNDMIFPVNTMEALLALADPVEVPILCAIYLTPLFPDPDNKERLEFLPAWAYDGGRERSPVLAVDFDQPLMELHGCGMGCTLIHRSVFETMREAYPDDPWKWFNHDLVHVEGRDPERLGEDFTFCVRARELGFKVWGTPDVRCGHIKTQLLYPLSYREERQPTTQSFMFRNRQNR